MIGVLGVGRWGSNYVNALREMEIDFATCDKGDDFEAFLRSIDRVIIATPSDTHFDLAAKCLRAGKHVMVEKPMAFHVKQVEQLYDIALENGRILYPALLMEHHEAVRRIKDMNPRPDHVHMVRVQVRRPATDMNILYNLALHDIDIALYWFGMPDKVTGRCDATDGYVVMDYGDFNVFIRVSYNEEKRVMTRIYQADNIAFDDVAKTLRQGTSVSMLDEPPLPALIEAFMNVETISVDLAARATKIIEILERICH